MSDDEKQLSGPDLAQGISLADLPDGGQLVVHSGGEAVLVVRRGEEMFAIGTGCTHYGGPLHEGIVVDDTVRCPWHHACFSLRTGEAIRAPALDPIRCWAVERQDGRVRVTHKLPQRETPRPAAASASRAAMVIVGAGAAGNAAAEMLRRRGHQG